MDEEQLQEFLDTALEAATEGARILKDHWGKQQRVENKGYPWDLVTEVDRKSEDAILDVLESRHPDHPVLAEESGLQSGTRAEFLWVIDPLDGTTNYTHRFPFVSISIGLLYYGAPIVAVIDAPLLNERFWAKKGGGAHSHEGALSVSQAPTLEKSLLVTGFAYDRAENPTNNYKEFCHMTNLTQGVRRIGSAAIDLAYVAAGRLDGHWERGLAPWDIAAGILLVEEAGGRVTDYGGESIDLERKELVATNSVIHEELIREIRRA